MRLQVYGCNHVATDVVKVVDLHNQSFVWLRWSREVEKAAAACKRTEQ
jgi:hypothetical protein